MNKPIVIDDNGRAREFVLRSNLPLSVRDWWSDVLESFDASKYGERYEREKAESSDMDAVGRSMYGYLIRHIVSRPDLVQRGLECGFIGDHTGIDWRGEIDGEITNGMIADLVAHFFVSAAQTMSASSTSSQPTPTDSAATTDAEITGPTSTES